MSFFTEVSIFFLKYAEELFVAGKYINVAGMFFQTRVQFLENSCALASVCGRRVSHPAQKIWNAVFDERRYGKKDKMILKEMSSLGYHRALGDLSNNRKDIMRSSFRDRVVAYGDAKYDAECDLLVYSVAAMVHFVVSYHFPVKCILFPINFPRRKTNCLKPYTIKHHMHPIKCE